MRASTPACSSPPTEARRRRALALSAAACLAVAPPAGAELLELDVRRAGDGFDVRFEVTLEVAPGDVRRLFTEPGRWVALSGAIVRSGAIDGAAAGGAPVETVFRDCILFFCREVRKVVRYRGLDAGTISAVSVAGAGDFRHLEEHWDILPEDGGTRIVFSARIEPDFRIPPVIGPMLMRSTLRRMLGEMEHNLEAMARIAPADG